MDPFNTRLRKRIPWILVTDFDHVRREIIVLLSDKQIRFIELDPAAFLIDPFIITLM